MKTAGTQVGNFISEAMKQKGIRASVLARETGIGKAMLSLILSGQRNVSLLQAVEISRVTGIKVEHLLEAKYNLLKKNEIETVRRLKVLKSKSTLSNSEILHQMNEASFVFSALSISRRAFWETNISLMNMEHHETFIIEKILNFGKWSDIRQISSYYGFEKIMMIGIQSQNINPTMKKLFQILQQNEHKTKN
ncbi:MAG: helix-turn-helix transcriptional regulator [Bacteroidetes bacterium]|nr:helix-turn-helix transcriptional regulator [Bacteroidota bacterium]MBU1719335.1 helix-turn-helix transcriptional regulator [Bacteroidota bacterium]